MFLVKRAFKKLTYAQDQLLFQSDPWKFPVRVYWYLLKSLVLKNAELDMKNPKCVQRFAQRGHESIFLVFSRLQSSKSRINDPMSVAVRIEYFLLLKVLCCFFYFLNIQRFGITSPSIQHTRLFWELDVREEMWYSPGHELKWFPSV